MQAYIEAQGSDVWNKVFRSYKVLVTVTDLNKTDVDLNAQARNLLFQGISHKEFDRVTHVNSTYLIQKTLCDYHEGTTRIKKVRKNLYQKDILILL